MPSRYVIVLAAFVCCTRPVPVARQSEPAPAADSTMATPPQTAPQAATITVAARKGRSYANIRLFADDQSAVMVKVPVGTTLKTFGRDGEWYQVQVPTTGALGWIRSIYLEG